MPTQLQIAEHIDLDQSAVSRFVDKVALDYRSATMDEIRIAYIRHLREMAAGRSSESGVDLVAERAMTERVDREIKLLTLAEKKGQLVNAAQLEAEFGLLVDAFRSELLALPERLVQKIRALYGTEVDVELINDVTLDALGQLSRYDPDGSGRDSEARPPYGASAAYAADELGTALPEVG